MYAVLETHAFGTVFEIGQHLTVEGAAGVTVRRYLVTQEAQHIGAGDAIQQARPIRLELPVHQFLRRRDIAQMREAVFTLHTAASRQTSPLSIPSRRAISLATSSLRTEGLNR